MRYEIRSTRQETDGTGVIYYVERDKFDEKGEVVGMMGTQGYMLVDPGLNVESTVRDYLAASGWFDAVVQDPPPRIQQPCLTCKTHQKTRWRKPS